MNDTNIKYIVQEIEEQHERKVKKHKKSKVEYNCFTKKQFKQYQKTMSTAEEPIDITTIGSTTLKQVDISKKAKNQDKYAKQLDHGRFKSNYTVDTVAFERELDPAEVSYAINDSAPLKVVGLETELRLYKKWHWYISHYISVGNYDFVAVCKNWVVLLLAILIILIPVGTSTLVYITNQPQNGERIETSGDEWNGILPPSGKNSIGSSDVTQFPGYSHIVVTRTDPNFPLVNFGTNNVAFEYVLVDSEGEVLHTSSKIGPGKMLNFAMGRLYDETGLYDLTMKINTYDLVSGAVCTGVSMDIVLEIQP